MYRIHFHPRLGFILQVLTLGLFWSTVKGDKNLPRTFPDYLSAEAAVQSLGLNRLYLDKSANTKARAAVHSPEGA